MDSEEIIRLAANDLELATTGKPFTRQLLIDYINDLLQHNFQKLVSILYRTDIDEMRLQLLLKQNPGQDAAVIITDMIIERQVQKIRSREQFKMDDRPSEEEKW
jgi:hypothetical protein